jgi:hypothetical protein
LFVYYIGESRENPRFDPYIIGVGRPLSKETAVPLLTLCKELPPPLGRDEIPIIAVLKGDAGLCAILREPPIDKLLRIGDSKGSRRYTQFRERGGIPRSSEKFPE